MIVAGDAVAEAYERARAATQPAWISLVPWAEVKARVEALRDAPGDLPLRGVPFAIKDNIDLAGVPTTAACTALDLVPRRSAFVVERLIAAGAIPIGKTNMDQFATGLTGTRSPYGACHSVYDERSISGGSSSGSAVVVADGTVPFSLGTDTAGSGRVPAALNGIVGYKPSRGRLSNAGMMPACRSLDCMSVFARDVATAARVTRIAAGRDPRDPYSRDVPPPTGPRTRPLLAVGDPGGMSLGDGHAAAAWAASLRHAVDLGWELVGVDVEPLLEAGRLLYGGPWVAERYAAIAEHLERHPDAIDPSVARVLSWGRDHTAADAFRAQHRLAELAAQVTEMLGDADALLLPTVPTTFTHEEVAADPIERNAALGTYTTFANLLDLAAVAVPAGMRADGLPWGVSLLGPNGSDERLVTLASRWNGEAVEGACAPGAVTVAVVGAHLSGEPLNHQLTDLGAQLVETTRTAVQYRLYALPGGEKPGLVRTGSAAGPGIEVELWSLSAEALGRLLAGVPPPLSIGTIALADGRAVKGFLCETEAVAGATDITEHGGWRAYRAV